MDFNFLTTDKPYNTNDYIQLCIWIGIASGFLVSIATLIGNRLHSEFIGKIAVSIGALIGGSLQLVIVAIAAFKVGIAAAAAIFLWICMTAVFACGAGFAITLPLWLLLSTKQHAPPTGPG